jgi:hypothetical protein
MNTIKKITPTGKVEAIESKEIIAHENQIVKTDADIDGFIAKRQEFIQKVNAICVEGKDFHIIQGKKSLAKGGAEKIASIFHWTAKFEKDTESLEMLGMKEGLVAFKCTLLNGEYVGEGRGAALLAKNSGDPNKTLKMAQKSAFIDAVLRASGLSDFYTQDLEDIPKEEISRPNNQPTSTRKPSEKQAKLIQDLCKQKNIKRPELIELAKGNTPSQLIDILFKHSTNSQEETVIDENSGKVIDSETGQEIEIPF